MKTIFGNDATITFYNRVNQTYEGYVMTNVVENVIWDKYGFCSTDFAHTIDRIPGECASRNWLAIPSRTRLEILDHWSAGEDEIAFEKYLDATEVEHNMTGFWLVVLLSISFWSLVFLALS